MYSQEKSCENYKSVLDIFRDIETGNERGGKKKEVLRSEQRQG